MIRKMRDASSSRLVDTTRGHHSREMRSLSRSSRLVNTTRGHLMVDNSESLLRAHLIVLSAPIGMVDAANAIQCLTNDSIAGCTVVLLG